MEYFRVEEVFFSSKPPYTGREETGKLYITDSVTHGSQLQEEGKAVLFYCHRGNRMQEPSSFSYVVEDIEEAEHHYFEQVYRRIKGLPWIICETDRCIVREMVPEDAPAFFQMYEDHDISRFLTDIHASAEAEADYIRDYIRHQYGFYEYGIWTVLLKETGEIIGRAGFSPSEETGEPELGYLIKKSCQGQGLGYEVCHRLLESGSTEYGFDSITLRIRGDNLASLALAQKLCESGHSMKLIILDTSP